MAHTHRVVARTGRTDRDLQSAERERERQKSKISNTSSGAFQIKTCFSNNRGEGDSGEVAEEGSLSQSK